MTMPRTWPWSERWGTELPVGPGARLAQIEDRVWAARRGQESMLTSNAWHMHNAHFQTAQRFECRLGVKMIWELSAFAQALPISTFMRWQLPELHYDMITCW